MKPNIEKLLDTTGRQILHLLYTDARLSYAEIGRRVHLSTPAVIERIEKLEAAGVIRGYTAQVDPAILGYTVTAIVTLTTTPAHYPLVAQIVEAALEIETCDHVAGDASFIMRVSAGTIGELETVIGRFQGIGTTQTAIVMSAFDTGDTMARRILNDEMQDLDQP